MRRRVLTVAFLGLAASTIAGVSAAQPSSATVAEALFQEAQALLHSGKITEACTKFAASLAAERALGTLLNLAACHERDGKTATAWAEFFEAQSQATRANDPQRAAYARQHIATLERTLHRVVIEVLTPTDGTEVRIDGGLLSQGAWGTAIPLDPGDHVVEVHAPGKTTFKRTVHSGPSGGTDRIEVPPLEDVNVAGGRGGGAGGGCGGGNGANAATGTAGMPGGGGGGAGGVNGGGGGGSESGGGGG